MLILLKHNFCSQQEKTLREENQRLQTQVVAMNNDNETNGMMSGSFEPLFGLLKQ